MSRSEIILRRSAWVAWLILAASGCGLAWMMTDTDPPFAMFSASTNSPKAGEVLRVDAYVKRQLSRKCSVTFSRHIFDSLGTRFDLTSDTFMPATALEQLDAIAPGRLRLSVYVPEDIAPGPAKLVTPLSYVCNAWHSLRPIEMVMTVDFQVMP